MNRLLIFLIAGLSLSGCVTQPQSPWADIEVPRGTSQQPLDCPKLPQPAEFTEDSVTFTADQLRQIDAYKACAEANAEIARLHARQLDARKQAESALVAAGQAQWVLTQTHKEILQQERSHWLWERAAYWVGLALALGAR